MKTPSFKPRKRDSIVACKYMAHKTIPSKTKLRRIMQGCTFYLK